MTTNPTILLVAQYDRIAKLRERITSDWFAATDMLGELLGEGVHQVGDWTVDVSRSGRYWVVLTSKEEQS